MARKIRHLVTIRIGMNKMAEGDKYLDYLDKTLEQAAKPWSTLLGAFFETKWRVLNSTYGQQSEAITFTKTAGRRQSGKNSSATKNMPMNATGTLWLCTEMETLTTYFSTFQENFCELPSFSWSMMAVSLVG